MTLSLRYRVVETQTNWDTFTVLQSDKKDLYDTILEAAQLYYFGRAGWQESWPLTFKIESLSGSQVAEALVFIMSGEPSFEIIVTDPYEFG